jgi:UDP-3-O-acyl-N-acetylglucosamine deacetylase
LIGDLALVGLPLLARVEAHKAGHSLHTQLVSRLLADPSLWMITTAEFEARQLATGRNGLHEAGAALPVDVNVSSAAD